MHAAGKYGLVAAVLAGAWWWYSGDSPWDLMRRLVGRGRRLTMMSLDSEGNVGESLEDLTAAAAELLGQSVTQDELLLAVLSSSEDGAGTPSEKAVIQRVAINRMSGGQSLVQVVTSGHGLGKQGALRAFSTARDAYEEDLQIARQNLGNELEDLSLGATRFVHATGFTKATGYADVCRKWFAESGVVPVDIGGVRSLRIFVPLAKAITLGIEDEAVRLGLV